MAKQEEQKQKASSAARQVRPVASVPPRSSAARTGARALPEEPASGLSEEAQQRIEARKIRRRQFLIGGLGVTATAAVLGNWFWVQSSHSTGERPSGQGSGDQVVIQWNDAALQAIRDLQPPMPVTARALAILHTCMFDAWAAYDSSAVGTRLGTRLRRPEAEHTQANKAQAVSYAAYHALLNLFPTQQTRLRQLMGNLGYNPVSVSTNSDTPAGIGMVAAQAVLDFRQRDGSNQPGDFAPGAYADYTQYRPLNTPEEVKDPNRWQPLRVPNSHFGFSVQRFDSAQWGNVLPFALSSPAQFLPVPGPPRDPSSAYTEQARQILRYSAGLNDEQKVSAEYWTNGPNQEQPPGHWSLFAQLISQNANFTLDRNVKLFFILANTLLDASIACWAAKRTYDSSYPVTAIHYLFRGQDVRAWAGPGRGVQDIDGSYWQPYQPATLIAPACPEYCSELSAFSSAAAEVLRRFTGSDQMNLSYTQPASSSRIEPGTPARDITLSWRTFTQAADHAGLSSRYSGTHFTQSDLAGRTLGRQVGAQVWLKALSYINSQSVPRSGGS